MTVDWIIQYGFQTVITGVVGYIIAQLKAQRKQAAEQQAQFELQQQSMLNGVKAILKDRLISATHKAKKQGFVYFFELENINSMFDEYRSLGGNGSVLHLMKEISQLPTKTDLN